MKTIHGDSINREMSLSQAALFIRFCDYHCKHVEFELCNVYYVMSTFALFTVVYAPANSTLFREGGQAHRAR
jgi:hypothetical protein